MRDFFTKQKHIPFIGEFRQLLGEAMTWIQILILIFSFMAAWNTNTMYELRLIFPWLGNIFIFGSIIIVVIILIMWLGHKYIQPSILAYWNKMQYEHNNPLRADVKRIEDANKEGFDQVNKRLKAIEDKLR